MATTKLTADDARQSLNGHVALKGAEIRAKYGPNIGWDELLRILEDRTIVRYPCEIVFDGSQLGVGEFAHPFARGEKPEEGFRMCVHPVFQSQQAQVPFLVLYQIVLVNYGEFASSNDAETFGASAFGMTEDEYYKIICALADQVGGEEQPHACGCGE